MKTLVLMLICVVVLVGCYSENRRPVNLDPVIEATAPVAVKLFVPEPWRTLALLALASMGGGVIGRKTKKK